MESIVEIVPRSDSDPTLIVTRKPIGTCCYGNCYRPSAAIMANLGRNAPAPVVMERRPFCQRHADEYAALNERLGIDFELYQLPMRTDVDEYIAAGEAFTRGEIDRLPNGVYRAHRSIAPWTCAHCNTTGGKGQTIGYCSALPDGHKVICSPCFHGQT